VTVTSPALHAKTAIVTGAASGIGRAIAIELAERGTAVMVTDINDLLAEEVAEEIRKAGGVATAMACDVVDAGAIRRVADAADAEFGHVDIWVANAGVSSMYPFVEIPRAEWQVNFDVNTTGVFLCGQEAARRLGPGGVIVNIASMAGKQGRVPFLAHYVASKFAVVGLTQAMAYELGPKGIRVNAVCPGFVATAMQERELLWEGALRGTSPEAVKDGMIAETPLGRLESPEDVARVVAFLCGPDAEFVTGESIAVNGGAYMD
jgi:NAD(P)-dependent dehydrogenase (short-subunit alcohol dehydrogenase family)